MKTGIELITKERKEHVSKHHINVGNDIIHNDGQQLRIAARKLLIKADGSLINEQERLQPPEDWDKQLWLKMITKDYKSRLIIAASLIAAEIDRVQV